MDPFEGVPLLGVHHVTLTVTDLSRSEGWYSTELGFVRVAEHDRESFRRVILRHPVAGLLLGLSQRRDSPRVERFDEGRPGLDHLAFRVPDRPSLEAWAARLDEYGVQHSGVQDATQAGYHLVAFRDPDGIQLEMFFAPVNEGR
jgi:glyoxylase I family protein